MQKEKLNMYSRLTKNLKPGKHKPQRWVAKESFFPDQSLIIDGHSLLEFKVNDELEMIDAKVQKAREMYLMKHKQTLKTGLVSKIKVGRSGTIDFEPWYFGDTSRYRAESYLSKEQNIEGSFLIRDSSKKGNYSLTLKVYDTSVKGYIFNHYLIKCFNGEYFISDTSRFLNLGDLVKFYQKTWKTTLPAKLTNVCIRPHNTNIAVHETSWNISQSEIELNEMLGKGSFGTVLKGVYKGVHIVAVKFLNGSDESLSEEFKNETNILKSFHHPNLVQVIGVVSEISGIVLEYLPGGDLLTFLKRLKNSRGAITDKLVDIARDIACGMRELERVGIVHRDLAARNVLLDDWDRAKVADFGLARRTDEYKSKQSKMPYKWSAIESIKDKVFTNKSDVWSFGIVLWEIFSLGEKPYKDINNKDLLTYLAVPNRLSIPNTLNNPDVVMAMYKIMIACWNTLPESRPSMSDLYSDLKDFNAAEVKELYDSFSKYLDEPAKDDRSAAMNDRKKKTDIKICGSETRRPMISNNSKSPKSPKSPRDTRGSRSPKIHSKISH